MWNEEGISGDVARQKAERYATRRKGEPANSASRQRCVEVQVAVPPKVRSVGTDNQKAIQSTSTVKCR